MNVDPILIIDTYLSHVREHLPESSGDEVISELRGYMIEMAEAVSDGVVTTASAKRVVARFGAPSELAKEYTLSDSDTAETIARSYRREFESEVQHREQSHVSHTGAFLTFVTICLLWLVVTWTLITPLAYWWTTTYAILVPILQFGVIAISFAIILQRSKSRGLQLTDGTHWNVSGLQKMVTFPENLAIDISGTGLLVEVGVTLLTMFGFVVLTDYRYFAYTVPIVLSLAAHLVYSIRRLGDSDPVGFAKQEYAVNIVLFWLLSGEMAWEYNPWFSTIPSLAWISFGYSTLILYQLVIRAQDLWWESSDILNDPPQKSPRLLPDETKQLLSQTERTALRSIGSIVASFSATITFGFLLLLLTNTRIFGTLWHTHAFLLVVIASFFATASVGLASVYFGVRYYLIRSRGRTSVFGMRTRVEAFLDLIVVGGGLYLYLIPTWSYWAEELMSDVISLSQEADPFFRLVLSIATITWVLVLLLALIFRMVADLGDLKERDGYFANEVMALSGNLFMIGAALIAGIYFMILTSPVSYMSILLKVSGFSIFFYAVLVLFAFQKSTAGAKLKWRDQISS